MSILSFYDRDIKSCQIWASQWNADLHSALREHIQPFDADILDHEIPTMNGLEVVKEVLGMNVGLVWEKLKSMG